MIRKFVERVVDVAGRFPLLVLLLALATVACTWTYAAHLELRSDFLELLPRESPGFRAFEHQLGRTGGGASLYVIVESPDRRANEKFIDTMTEQLQQVVDTRKECIAKCGTDNACTPKCGADLISYIETGTKEVRKFFEDHKWLYADLDDLENADQTL